MAADRRRAGDHPAVSARQVRKGRTAVMARARTNFGMGRVVLDATAEAHRRGDRRVGTDHIALAMLSDPHSESARALDVSLDAARTALQALDAQALATLGIDAS